MFLAYVRQCVVPILKRGEIVIIDNLPAHKVAGVRSDRSGGCNAALPPIVFARSQPDRAGLQQIQGTLTQGS
jgi:hypothetical protein